MRIYRIGSGLSVMGALIWLLWPQAGWKIEPEPAIAFVAALVVWLWREVSDGEVVGRADAAKSPHPHDLELARKVKGAFSDRTRNLLRHHDFGVVFHRDAVAPLFEIADGWHGIEYEFEDTELDNAMFELIRLSRELGYMIAPKSGPVRHERDLLAVPNDEERGNDIFSDKTSKAVSQLNELATQVLEAYEKLERLMRAQVPSLYQTA